MRGKFSKDYWIIKFSGLFDKAYYLKQYDDVRRADIDPIEHYVLYGWKEGRNPAPWFDTKFYLENNPDVANAGVNPFVHWIRWGRREGRKPSSIQTNEGFFTGSNKNRINKIRFLAKVIYEGIKKPYLVRKFFRDLKTGGIYYAIYKTKAYINRKNSLHVEQRADTNEHKNETSSCSLLIEYFNQLFENTKKLNERETFVPYKEHERINTDIKLVAFYLPQFHPIPENDEFWEKGFTEWTNVTKAVPQFLGHYQPRLPIDLGFYDLRLIDNIKRQVELAKNYGIYGFAFHHYWFGGRKVLRTPIELFLKHKEIDFKFCVHFANENWTRRWDGLDHEVLLKQEHSPEDDIAFIEDTARYFRDERYIRIKGKPLLIVYRPELFPNIKETVERWREWCHKNGIGDIYLACMHSFVHTDPREIGFDAAIDYPPNTYPLTEINEKFTIINPNYQGRILSYDELIHISKSMPKPPYKKFRGICPSWDNEARRPGRGTVVHGSTPEKYEAWLTYLLEYTENNFEPEERFIFINAWNEWAEGAYLEPDRKFGYAYLEATWRALYFFEKSRNCLIYKRLREAKKREDERFSKPETKHLDNIKIYHVSTSTLINPKSKSINKPKAVFLHAFYIDEEIHKEFVERINKIPQPCKVYISTDSDYKKKKLEEFYSDALIHEFEIRVFPNRGRDIAPLIVGFKEVMQKYDIAIHLHTKKSPHNSKEFGEAWRKYMLNQLLFNEISISNILSLFDNPKIGLVFPVEWSNIKPFYEFGSNFELVKELVKLMTKDRVNLSESVPLEFPAGSFFWFRPKALEPLLNIGLDFYHFPAEPINPDGELPHAIERVFTFSCILSGYGFVKYKISEEEERIGNSNVDEYINYIDLKT